jgi:DNA-damage-inducible protein J
MANKTETLRVRMEPKTKQDAEKIFAMLGLSATDAVTMFYKQVKYNKGIPFEPKIPNASLRKTLREIEAKKGLTRYDSLDELRAKFETKH